MLYCKRAFLKRILKVDDVIHDILPCPFRMHNKSQPKVKTPSCTTGKADPRLLGREGAVLVFSCEVCRKRLQEWEELQSCWPDASSIQLELVYRAGPNRPSVGRWDRDASAPPCCWNRARRNPSGWCYGRGVCWRQAGTCSLLHGFVSWHAWMRSAELFWCFLAGWWPRLRPDYFTCSVSECWHKLSLVPAPWHVSAGADHPGGRMDKELGKEEAELAL